MQIENLNEIISKRAIELLAHKEINKIYQSHSAKKEAQDWIYKQAIYTLYFSPEERVKHYNN